MLDRAREKGIVVGALAGAREHAIKHAEAGVDVIIVSGTEAGGHCGEVSTMVLVPEVLEALKTLRRHSRARRRRYRYRPPDGRGDGHGRGRRLVRFSLAHHGGSGNRARGQGEND